MANVYRDYFNTLLERLRTTYLERRKEERQNELRLMSGNFFPESEKFQIC